MIKTEENPNWLKLFENCTFQGSLHFSEPLSKHTFFKIGGLASLVALPKKVSDLELLSKNIQSAQIPFFILGLGSNILAPDGVSKKLYIKMTQFGIQAEASGDEVISGPGMSVASFLRKSASEGWDGFEFMSGIPGTLGGVVAMNGGTHLGEAAAMINSVETFSLVSGARETYTSSQLKFSYRKNHFIKPGEVITQIHWKKKSGEPEKIKESLDSLYRRRKETQPLDFPSCGSVFKNPEATTLRAWEVVDRLGLRGHRIGNAQFAEKHPNWILNLGGASAQDVVSLITLAKSRAQVELGISLQEEVKILSE